MNKKFLVLVSGAVLAVALFHQHLSAEDANAPVNAFMDEGNSDFEMPKPEVHKPHEAKKARSVASEEDDDNVATGTKGDAFDQIQAPGAAATVQAPAEPNADMATSLENKLPAKAAAKSKRAKPEAQASDSTFTRGFKTTKDGDCVMYEAPDKSTTQILVVKGAKKLWVEQEGDWLKAFHKKGSGYLAADCFE